MADEELEAERVKREILLFSGVLEPEGTVPPVPGDVKIERANETNPRPCGPVGQHLLILAALSEDLQSGFALTVGCIIIVRLNGRIEPLTNYDTNIFLYIFFIFQL